ncbi:Hypothetical predicted protein [Marmota monax]|uniref:Uncharacterized protein n=1 Tax=Marmota monax TaxID=9995 RepID=A0A5E4BX94_MARMO|nr:hypothetical protein GHT09_014269 [Marmota monax]VTJ74224.1 Hypothetical predicted protein [Marmota monax]
MMRRPPTGLRLVTHCSPWLQHKATSPGGRFLPEERLGRPEKAQGEEEAEEEEGNRRFPNTLSKGAVRGARLGPRTPSRRRESGPGLPAVPLPLLHRAQTRNKVAEGDPEAVARLGLWPRRRRRRRRGSSVPRAPMGVGGVGAHDGGRSSRGGGDGGGAARGDAAAVGRDGRAQ